MAIDRRRPFYGYWVVLASFLSIGITFGCGFYAFSLFVSPLQGEFGWSRGDVMLGFTIFFLMTGLVAPQAGRVVDRRGARLVLCAGAAITGAGFLLLHSMSSLWHYYVGYAVVGLGMAGTGPITTSAVVSNWFAKGRGTAVGIMSSGVGIGGLVLSPVIGTYLVPTLGWRDSFLILGMLCCAVIIPLGLLVVRSRPEEKGLRPYGASGATVGTVANPDDAGRPSTGATLGVAMGTMTFWLIVATFLLCHFAQVGAIQNQVPLLEDAGFPVAVTAGALGAVGLFSAFAKFGFGWLCDKIQPKFALAIGLAFQVVSIIVLMNVQQGSPEWMAWLYACTMGLGIGSWLPTMSMLVSGYFGLRHYGSIFGAITIPYCVGSAVGPLAAGRMYDASGSYDSVFVLFLALFIASIVTILLCRRPAAGQR